MYEKNAPCEGEKTPCLLKEALDGKRPVTAEHCLYDKNNKLKTLEVHGHSVYDPNGKVVEFIEYSLDITDRKLAEEKVMTKVEQLLSLRSIDIAINASLDLRVTLDVLLEQVTRLLDVDAADVLLYNTHINALEFLAGRGFRTSALRYTNLCLGEGYAGKAARERKTKSMSRIYRKTAG